MKRFVIGIGALAGTLLLAFAEAEAAKSCPKEGGALRVGLIGDITNLDPFRAGAISAKVHMNIFESLTRILPDGTIAPALATDWKMLDDKTWRFQLRKGVSFHSGTPFNAGTVKWNVETQLNPDKPGKAYAILSGLIKEVRVVDDYTVDIELIRPYAPFVTFVTTSNEAFGQRDPVKAEELGEKFGTTPSGTGPFKYKEWKLGSHVILDRNPDHWEGAPCVDALEFKILPEASTRYAALRSGEIEFTTDLPSEQIAKLEGTQGFNVQLTPSDRVISLLFNRQHAVLDDVRVRRAVSLSLDTKLIADKLMGVIGAPTDSFIGPNHLGYMRVGFLEYDPQRAKALLAEAGYEPGTNPLKLNLGVGPERDPRNKEIAELIQASLQAIGAQVKLTAITWKVFYGTLRKKEGMVYDLIILGFGSQSSDPQHSLYNQFHSVNIPPTAHNFSRLRHAEMDRLLTQQASTFDADKRLELIKRIQKIIYDDVLAVPMYVRNRDFEMVDYVKGFKPHPIEWYPYLYSSVWLDR